jgi:Dolichyl-phosphate-mannose-protein mannosyltransferase
MQPTALHTSNLTRWRISHRVKRWLTPAFLLLGVECWLLISHGSYGHQIFVKPVLILAAIACGLVPPIRSAFNRLWIMAARPSPRTRLWIATAIWIGSSLFLFWTQRVEKTAIHPKFHDEFSYLIQMRMIARGRLWMPAIPCGDFFDTFYILVKPAYASMYFPGAAMLFAPALILHLPYVVAPLAASGLCAAMIYLVISELLDGSSGILAVLILLSMGMFRMMSIMLMAEIPILLFGLTMTFAFLRWRKRMQWRWLVLLGAVSGWAAITRPAEAFCFALVIGSAIVIELWGKPWQFWAKVSACVILPVIPFLSVQLVLNRNVTGHWLTSPFAYYTDLNYPGAFGFHSGPAPQHVSDIAEKQQFYEQFAKGVIEQHQWKNVLGGLRTELAAVATAAMPDPFFWLTTPLAILAIWFRRYWVVWGMLPLYLLVLAGYSFSWVLPHYVIVVIPTTLLFCVLPIRFLTDTFPRRTAMIRTMVGLGMLAMIVADMPQMDRTIHDQYFETPELEAIDAILSRQVSPPAVVMFHFNKNALIDGRRITDDANVGPVFNSDVAWPDDAPIIRAHDLNADVSNVGKPGDRNVPLYEYYLRVDPNRVFYLYDRGAPGVKLRRLGTAADLLGKIEKS